MDSEYDEPAKRLGLRPTEESAYIDDISPDDIDRNRDDYDMNDPASVAAFNFDKERAKRMKCVVDLR